MPDKHSNPIPNKIYRKRFWLFRMNIYKTIVEFKSSTEPLEIYVIIRGSPVRSW